MSYFIIDFILLVYSHHSHFAV